MQLFAAFNLVILLVLSALALGSFAFGIASLTGRIRAGGPDTVRTNKPWLRLATTVGTVLSHSTFKNRPLVRAAHWLVMISFPALFLTLISGFGQALDPNFELGYLLTSRPWMIFTNTWAWAGLLGITALTTVRLMGRRKTLKNKTRGRFTGSNHAHAYFVEAVVFVVCACVLILHYGAGAGCSINASNLLDAPGFTQNCDSADYGLLSPIFTKIVFKPIFTTQDGLNIFLMIIACLKVAVSLLWMIVIGLTPTMGVAWHRFLAIFNLYFHDNPRQTKPTGYYPPLFLGGGDGRELTAQLLDNPQEIGDNPRLGAITPRDLSWKSLLDAASCTECGRCQEACPAWTSGKDLSPKNLVMTIRDTAMDQPIIGKTFTQEALWQCTNCAACVQACPVGIDHVSLITQLRRGQVLNQGQLPRDYTKILRKVQSKGNPWGIPVRTRLDWVQELDFKIPIIGQDLPDASSVDYLLWVGAGASFSSDSSRTTRAVATLLHMAGVTFAVLGKNEPPTGELARQLGDEVSYLHQSAAAIATLRAAAPRGIICISAHVYNLFTHDYKRQGADFKVFHHTQILNRLVREEKLELSPPRFASGKRPVITYQDPCFLTRHGGQSKAGRELLTQMGNLIEMPKHDNEATCCGGGAGGAFVEESQGLRICDLRAKEAAQTGARFLATACPFCHLMLESGMSSMPSDQRLEVRDVAQLMLEVARPGKASPKKASPREVTGS